MVTSHYVSHPVHVCVCVMGGCMKHSYDIFSAVSLHLLELTDKSLHL